MKTNWRLEDKQSIETLGISGRLGGQVGSVVRGKLLGSRRASLLPATIVVLMMVLVVTLILMVLLMLLRMMTSLAETAETILMTMTEKSFMMCCCCWSPNTSLGHQYSPAAPPLPSIWNEGPGVWVSKNILSWKNALSPTTGSLMSEIFSQIEKKTFLLQHGAQMRKNLKDWVSWYSWNELL